MKELLRSHSLSYVQGLQVALEAEGIETALFDQQTIGFLGFAGRVRLVVRRDVDYERARQIVGQLELERPAPTVQEERGWRLQRWGCVVAALGVILLGLAGAAAADIRRQLPLSIAHGLIGVAVLVCAGGLVLIVFGPRWGQRPSDDRRSRD